MSTFVDTSAFYALLDETDRAHAAARGWLTNEAPAAGQLETHSYVVVESIALVTSRLGPAATRKLLDVFVPITDVTYVEEPLHAAAITVLRATAGRKPSFVDRVSFEFMHLRGITRAFAFDADFRREGFELVPA